MNHPVDPRFDFSDEDVRSAVADGRLLSMEVEFTRACNYRCSYCYATVPAGGELPPETFKDVLKQAADLGARKIVVLGGEPLLYPRLEEMLEHIRSLGMVSEIFTNGALITPEKAEMLIRYPVRVIVKLNTLNAELQDKLTGVKGALRHSLDAIRILQEAGYDKLDRMLGASTVLTTANIQEVPAMWDMLRSRNLLPYFECLTPQGRLMDNQDLLPSPEQLQETFEILRKADVKYGYEWDPQPPLVGGKCFRHQYSCVVKSDGTVIPCVGLDAKIGDIRKTPLKTILSESLILYHLKNYRKFIKGPCSVCEKADHCYGCRGTAFQTTGDYLASDPTCWRNKDKQDRIVFLPRSAKGMLPHDSAMLFVDRLVKLGERQGVTESRIRPDNPFLRKDGVLAREALIEYAAQTAALLDSHEKDGRVSPGLLIEVKDFSFAEAEGKAGDEIVVDLKKEFDMDIWHGISVRITINGAFAAQGELKLCIFDSPVPQP